MKNPITPLAAAAVLSAASSFALADDANPNAKLTFELPAGAQGMTLEEISDTRGEAVLKAGLKCMWKVICKPYLYTSYETRSYTDRYGTRRTYTRNH